MTEQVIAEHVDYRSLFEATPAPLLVLSTDFRILAVNDAYLQATQTRRADIVGEDAFEVFPDNPDVPDATRLEHMRATLERALRDGEPVSMDIQRFEASCPDGQVCTRFWSPINIPVLDDNGEVYQIIHRVDDFTDIMQTRHRVEEMAEQARQESRNKDQFLAMLGHELRNPMAAISTAVYVLQNIPTDSMPADRLEWGLDIVTRQIEHLSRLVDDLLDVARINEGRIELQRERVGLNEVVKRAVEATQPLIEEREQALDVVLLDESVILNADPTRLTQVIANLLNNAAKYTPEGGHIDVGCQIDNAEAVVRVADDGEGIDPDLLPHVFDLFTQAEVSLARSQGGLGLGLTLVRRLVELHDGTVDARSDGAGEGSTFTVRLPLPAVSPEPAVLTQNAADDPSGICRILVVDDNADTAETMAMLLELDGHQVEIADNGNHALDTAAEFRPQVILLDLNLPDMDGYEVARRLEALEEARQATLVAITGFSHPSDRRRSEEAGFSYHLVKPVGHMRLRQVLGWITGEE